MFYCFFEWIGGDFIENKPYFSSDFKQWLKSRVAGLPGGVGLGSSVVGRPVPINFILHRMKQVRRYWLNKLPRC